MTLRRKLLMSSSLIVLLAVAAVAWTVTLATKHSFERSDQQRASSLVAQFRRELDRRGQDVVRAIDSIAASEQVTHVATELSLPTADPTSFSGEAIGLATSHQLDYLELIAADGSIISSAQWPARFGYKESLIESGATPPNDAFLKREQARDGDQLGLFAARAVKLTDKTVWVLGGQRLDRDFLSSMGLPGGSRVFLYAAQGAKFDPKALLSSSDEVFDPEKLEPLIQLARNTGDESVAIVYWNHDRAASDLFHAVPLRGQNDQLLGILLIGTSRRELIELTAHIRSIALMVGGLGILLAILVSVWIGSRITRPVEQLAEASRSLALGNWDTTVEVTSSDEVGELAVAFNRMTQELIEQRDKLVQTERVAAWRELARRLAHELKNPLFPLQITVENLVRAREAAPEEFDEIFRESTTTLLAEINHLKTIIGRFSDFSKMPQPQLQRSDMNEIIRRVIKLVEPQLATAKLPISAKLELAPALTPIDVDPDLIHRALTNLVLNAMDAMPNGGTLTIRTKDAGEAIRIEVADTGTGLTPEECARLFAPYYTTKQHGTGLGLAIAQSVISDHHGRIAVQSKSGSGTTFIIELPKHASTNAAPEPKLYSTAAKQ